MSRSTARQRRLPDLLLTALLGLVAVALHAPLVFADTGLSDFDLVGYFYPYWQERAEVLRAGTLPLWTTHLFTGVPFLANIQTGVFYPLNLPLIPFDAPRAISLSYVGHVWIAAAGMYLLLRFRMALARPAAFTGAVVFAFGGFLAAQAGHINQVQTAAWLPLLLFAFITAHACRSLWWAVTGGVVLALQLLAGHPQELYLSLVAVAALAGYEAFRCAFREPAARFNRRFADREWFVLRIMAWAGYGGLILAVMGLAGAAMAAVQLLPSLELSGQGIRSGGLPYDAAVSFSLAPWELLRSLLPSYQEPPLTEYIAAPGCVALALGLSALLRAPWHRYTLYFLLLIVGGILVAVGNFAFWYPWLYDFVPGVNLFRVPARWLFLTAFGAAGLAALGMDHLLAVSERPAWRAVVAATLVFLAVAGVAIIPPWLYGSLGLAHIPAPDIVAKWLAFGLVAGALAVYGGLAWRPGPLPWLLLALLAAETVLFREPMPVSHPLPAAVFENVRPGLTHLLQDDDRFRVVSLANPAFEPGDIKELRTLYGASLDERAVRYVIESLKYQDILVPNTGMLYGLDTFDAYDGGMLPIQAYATAKRLILDLTGRAPGRDTRGSEAKEAGVLIRDAAGRMPDAGLLGAMNVKYLVADRLTDVWVDGVYHDLGNTHTLQPGERWELPLALDRPLPDGVTALSVATFLEGAAAVPAGTVVATLVVTDADGSQLRYPLRAGVETAESADPAVAGSARAVIDRRFLPGARVFPARFELGRPVFPRSVTVEASLPAGSLSVAGLALVDARSHADYSPSLDPDWPRVYTGDTKVYQNRRFQPRAYVASRAQLVEGPDQQLAALSTLPADATVLTSADASNGEGRTRGTVQVISYRPERVELDVALDQAGYVVLRDSYYPGWRATVDGSDAAVLRADYLFRAVPAPAGQHRVVFQYEPGNLRLGLVLSFWSCMAAVALLALAPAAGWVRRLRIRQTTVSRETL